MSKDLYHMIKNIQKVTGFLGPTGNPAPVSKKKLKKLWVELKREHLFQNHKLVLI